MMPHANQFKTVPHPIKDDSGVEVVAPPFVIVGKIVGKELEIEQREEIRQPVNCVTAFIAVLKPFLNHVGTFKILDGFGYIAAF